MGRDRMRVLLCAIASIALIIAGALVMDWYRLSISTVVPGLPGGGKIAIDLRNLYVCHARGCVGTSISPMPGMFPTLATVTMWASLGFAALVALQAGTRVLTGAANDAFAKLGYMLALLTIALAVATAYMFGPEDQGDMTDLVAKVGVVLPRTWAPLTLIAGLAAGFAAMYLAVAPESSDLATAYRPITVDPAARARTASTPLSAPLSAPLPIATARLRSGPGAPALGQGSGESLGVGSSPDVITGAGTRTGAGPSHARLGSSPGLPSPMSDVLPALTRAKSGPLPPLPAHLRNRLSYLALTAELTAGGIDARREDGSSRLVLWRDVVGVVARRLPADFDGTTFIDIVSTAGSTLRIVPWTRLTGEPVVGEGDDRPRGVVERVVAKCPDAKVDPATRLFLETGKAAQLPDLETLHAHDERLA
jgi:hypothetical protein